LTDQSPCFFNWRPSPQFMETFLPLASQDTFLIWAISLPRSSLDYSPFPPSSCSWKIQRHSPFFLLPSAFMTLCDYASTFFFSSLVPISPPFSCFFFHMDFFMGLCLLPSDCAAGSLRNLRGRRVLFPPLLSEDTSRSLFSLNFLTCLQMNLESSFSPLCLGLPFDSSFERLFNISPRFKLLRSRVFCTPRFL